MAEREARIAAKKQRVTAEDARQAERQVAKLYQDYGGSIRENAKKLARLAIAQIYEAIRNDRTSQDDNQ